MFCADCVVGGGLFDRSVAEETAQNASVLASLDDAAFISDDVVRFDAEVGACLKVGSS